MTHQMLYRARKIITGIIAVLAGLFLIFIADLFVDREFVFADGFVFTLVGISICFTKNPMPTDYGFDKNIKSRAIYQSITILVLLIINPSMFPSYLFAYGIGALIVVVRIMIIAMFILSLFLDLLHFTINKKQR